jgi:hypothetical protein
MGLEETIRRNAAPLLTAGEEIQAVIAAQLNKPGWHAGVGRKIVVVATDRRILVCEGGLFRRSVVRMLVRELPRNTEIGPARGYWGFAFRVPGLPSVPIWIPRKFFKDVAKADAARPTSADARAHRAEGSVAA